MREPRYSAARAALERSAKTWKAGDIKAADRIAQDGIVKLGRDGFMDKSDRWSMDHTSLRLLAAKDEERRGFALYALMDRRSVLMQRLAIYRGAHKCTD